MRHEPLSPIKKLMCKNNGFQNLLILLIVVLSNTLFLFQRHNCTVNRRYNDFVAFHDMLLLRFPYRLIPTLPPKKLMGGRFLRFHHSLLWLSSLLNEIRVVIKFFECLFWSRRSKWRITRIISHKIYGV